jgi:small-conductance mechanosensitive channel
VFAWTAWSIAALNAVGLLDPLIEFLRGASMEFGEVSINAWTVVKGLIVTGALFWVAFILTDMISKRLETVETLNSALRLLISKIARIVLIVLAVVLGLSTAGVDLTAFTVFSGAIGLGIGLGMQRTVANLVASFSLLADKSLKPGDVIEFEAPQGATYGVVGKMTTRYVSVRTRDGTETLVPNETLISKSVTNWSYSDCRVRRKLPVGVSYDCDVEHARALCLEAAANCKRVLQTPPPACLLKGFGDNSVDLELRIWVGDPEGGVSNVASEVYLNVWRLFKEHDIEIPFPQRDLHIRSGQFPTESDPQE